MFQPLVRLIAILAVLISASACSSSLPTYHSSMPVSGRGYIPAGFKDFCRRNPGECSETASDTRIIKLTRSVWSEIEAVNAEINRTVVPVTDKVQYGVAENWTYPGANGVKKGDCEDFALAKQRALIQRGLPKSALLLATAYMPSRGMHAALVVRTDHGDYVLDSATTQIKNWDQTPYAWIARQSPYHPLIWERPARKGSGTTWASARPDLATASTGSDVHQVD